MTIIVITMIRQSKNEVSSGNLSARPSSFPNRFVHLKDPAFPLWVLIHDLQIVCVLCVFSRSVMSDSFSTTWTVARQAPLSMGFPKQEHWSGFPLHSPGDLPDPGTEPLSPALWASLVAQLVKNPPAMRDTWVSWTVWGRKESDTTEQLSLSPAL